jgi:hypothetical protein
MSRAARATRRPVACGRHVGRRPARRDPGAAHRLDGLIGRQPVVARQILRKLLVGRFVMTPKISAEGRYYEVTGQASYGALLAGVVGLVPPG